MIVTNTKTTTIGMKAPPYCRRKRRRCSRFIGLRAERASRSRCDGGLTTWIIERNTAEGSRNIAPAAAGIQASLTPCPSSQAPVDFITPPARMKLAHKPAVSASVSRRPSSGASTIPKTIPSGRPLTNSQAAFHGRGVIANASKASSATTTKPKPAAARRRAGISETTRMPINFESV